LMIGCSCGRRTLLWAWSQSALQTTLGAAGDSWSNNLFVCLNYAVYGCYVHAVHNWPTSLFWRAGNVVVACCLLSSTRPSYHDFG
jgi:hypothetical protein